jgi:hypothetical protein
MENEVSIEVQNRFYSVIENCTAVAVVTLLECSVVQDLSVDMDSEISVSLIGEGE